MGEGARGLGGGLSLAVLFRGMVGIPYQEECASCSKPYIHSRMHGHLLFKMTFPAGPCGWSPLACAIWMYTAASMYPSSWGYSRSMI
ncbi:hypothetical protein F4809DRAFT_611569 [Biscogniauxia mediterranea]|nr:hypothetical protein F4809DRAFT_611569 [Biscogniauxia mediterranea]